MAVHSNTYLKCGTLGISHCKRIHRFLAITTWNVRFPTLVDKCDRPGHAFRSIKMSSKVVENTGTNVVGCNGSHNFNLELSYETAMDALSSLISRQKRGDKSNVGGKYGKMERMSIYLEILGLDKDIDRLNIIHVAGTKGKGSTCAFCEAILRESGFRTGLFTSPHLIDVRERFRVDGLDIPEDKFLQYFWECWNQLRAKVTEDLPMPPLFQFLTVLAFKIFICEQVNVAIIEVGLGGKTDSTNVIKEPVVCGITSLGMDHMEALGYTLGEIASHKAGIFKPQVPAYTVPQLSGAMEVLHKTSQLLKVPLTVAAPLNRVQLEGLKLSLSGDHQLINAGLAISLCKCWLQRTGNWEKVLQNGYYKEASLPEPFLRGLSKARLSGRAQIVHDMLANSNGPSEMAESSCGDLIFYLDGAHSPESIEACAKWFSSAVRESNKSPSLASSLKAEHTKKVLWNGHKLEIKNVGEFNKISKQILLFNCMEVRNPQVLLPKLVSSCASSDTHFTKALFVPTMSTYNKVTSGASAIPLGVTTKDLSWQYNLRRIWENIIHRKEADVIDNSPKMDPTEALPPREFLYEDAHHCSAVIPSLPLTIKWLRDCVRENPSLRVQVLVTGSLHLVGDVLRLLKR